MLKNSTSRLKCALLVAFSMIACHVYVAAQGPGQYLDTVEFASSTDWTIPTNVFSATLEAWGGGGAGGYARSNSAYLRATGGGGGGAYARSIIDVTPGETMTIEVGIGGYNSGNNTESPTVVSGGNSYVRYAGAVKVRAAGGKSVTGVRNLTGAAGGAKADCIYNDVAYAGGKGGNASAGYSGAYCASGGGGGAAGLTANGSDGGNGVSSRTWFIVYIYDSEPGLGGAAGAGNPSSGKGGDGLASKIIGSWGGASGSDGEAYGGGGGGSISNGAVYAVGGAGAPGYVRIIYVVTVLDVNDTIDTICSGSSFNIVPLDIVNGIVPSGTKYTWTVGYHGANITGYAAQTSQVDAITGTLTNNGTTIDSVTYNVKAYNGTYTDEFKVTVAVYPPAQPGAISKDQLVCQNEIINQLVNDTDPSGGGKVEGTGFSWQVSNDGGTTWNDIAGATVKEYTPGIDVLTSLTNLVRRGYTTSCGTVYSNAVTLTNPNPLAPGSITVTGDAAGSYCAVDVDAELKANPSAASGADMSLFSYQWQESYDQGATWTDIPSATNNTYNVSLHPVTDTVSYRYQVRYDTCIWMVSNNTYDIVRYYDPDYTDQIDTLWITLYYGTTDTVFANLPAPVLTPNPTIVPNFDGTTRHGVGVYMINWTITLCSPASYDQVVVVQYPACGSTDTVMDYEGNKYATLSVGPNCWLARNLRSTKYSDGSNIAKAEGYYSADNPDRDANAEKFGRLYTWYSAVNVPENDNTATPPVVNGPTGDYIQGACPAGWALPTQAEYAQLWAALGDADNVKSADASTWLPGQNGNSLPDGFNAPGAGFYNADALRYENLLGDVYFWSASTGSSVMQGVCSTITHTCPQIVIENEMKGMGFSIRCIKKE